MLHDKPDGTGWCNNTQFAHTLIGTIHAGNPPRDPNTYTCFECGRTFTHPENQWAKIADTLDDTYVLDSRPPRQLMWSETYGYYVSKEPEGTTRLVHKLEPLE